MVADAENLKIVDTIFKRLDMGKYTIKVSNRKLLDAMIQLAGIPQDKFKTVCSSIDKLDKSPWKEVQQELIEKKGVTQEQCDRLHELVLLRGPPLELLATIEEKKYTHPIKLKDTSSRAP
jgi:histidyl-tRNA synthetase